MVGVAKTREDKLKPHFIVPRDANNAHGSSTVEETAGYNGNHREPLVMGCERQQECLSRSTDER